MPKITELKAKIDNIEKITKREGWIRRHDVEYLKIIVGNEEINLKAKERKTSIVFENILRDYIGGKKLEIDGKKIEYNLPSLLIPEERSKEICGVIKVDGKEKYLFSAFNWFYGNLTSFEKLKN